MRNTAMLKYILRSHRAFAIFCVLMTTMLEYIVISFMTAFDTESLYHSLMAGLPERLRMIMSENFLMQMGIDAAAAFGFNHPIVLVMIASLAIMIPARHISDAIENGSMEWLLAQPVNRVTLAWSIWFSGCVLLLLVICGGLAGLVSALLVMQAFTTPILLKMLQIGCNLWLLAITIMSMAMMIAAFGRAGVRTSSICAAIVLAFYLGFFFTAIWEWFAVTRPYNIFTYYQPQQLMFGRQSFAVNAPVLSGLIAVLLAITLAQFHRRDIPG